MRVVLTPSYMHRALNQALMWKCLRRKQQDQVWYERQKAAEALAARFRRSAARRRHVSTLSGAALLFAKMSRVVPRKAHGQGCGAARHLEAALRAAMARRGWVAHSEAGKLLSSAVQAVVLRDRAVWKMKTVVRSVLVCTNAWRNKQARLQLENRRRLKQEHDARVRLELARSHAATYLQAGLRRCPLRNGWRHGIQASRTLSLANLRGNRRRSLSKALAAGAVLNCRLRAACVRRQMLAAQRAARLLASAAARSLARNRYRRTVAGYGAAMHMTAALDRMVYMSKYAAAQDICRAAEAHAGRSNYLAIKSAAREMQLVVRSRTQRIQFVGIVGGACALEAARRRMPVRGSFALVVGAAAAIRRCYLARLARAQLKRRKDQRARDALLAPALVPSKQPALHEHLSPCPPKAARPASQHGPPGFRKRLLHSGSASICRAESSVPPLKGCKVPSMSSWDGGGDGSDGGEGVEDDKTRESRLLQQQQQRISEDIARAGGTRAPKDTGIFPHEVVQGGTGAALLALRTRNRGC